MDKVYDHRTVEEKWYAFWEKEGLFTPKIDPKKKPFVIAMPPPNVTGELHLGQALTATIEDILIRYHRLRGDPTLWIPGVDHAGIATQVVVERELAKEGKTRHDLGREKFVEKVWEWVNKYGRRIDEQHKKLGVSADWSRRKFTLDPDYKEAVQEAFKRLQEKDLIYRGTRVINWCPRCATTLSDLESIYKEEQGKLYHIDYGTLHIATTRPETIFADIALAVNPNDKRYKGIIDKKATIPLVEREIPIIEDELVDSAFGTGALKITPAHDALDFAIWEKHKDTLRDFPVVITTEGKLYSKSKYIPSQFWGLSVKKAREKVVNTLRASGKLSKEESVKHAVSYCQRCGTVIEPLVSEQWFVKMKPLAKPAIEAVKSGKIKIIPKRFEKIYFQWLENIKDWTISRQLWWGHEIPGMTDVLDTWFSSALWPFATLGWPKETEDFKYFYPTTVMETGYDILFFWVARMVMMGIEMTGKAPFETVYLHGLIRDPYGQKMSKSKGNVIDPLTMAKKHSTDALRISFIVGNTPGKDMRLSEAKIQGYRNFTNKVWNIGRFVLSTTSKGKAKRDASHPDDAWIVEELHKTVTTVTDGIEKFQFSDAGQMLYDFVWHTFADVYIEKVKTRREKAQPVLEEVLRTSLILLHPFMPFITEELYQRLPKHGKSIMVEEWPGS